MPKSREPRPPSVAWLLRRTGCQMAMQPLTGACFNVFVVNVVFISYRR